MPLVSPGGELRRRSERLSRSILIDAWPVGLASIFAPQGPLKWKWNELGKSNDPTQGRSAIAGICVWGWLILWFAQMALNAGDARLTR